MRIAKVDPAFCTLNCSLSAVTGATGGVGRLLVTELCSAKVPVRALVRSASKAQAVLPSEVSLAKVESFYKETAAESLKAGLSNVSTLFIVVGTTAYPTQRWFKGDTIRNVDYLGVRNILKYADKESLKRIVYASSIGTERASSFPFSALNLFGVLDVKRECEELIRNTGMSYAIVRFGRLSRQPMEKCDGAKLYRGDSGFGDCSRGLAARTMRLAGAVDENLDFSVIDSDKTLDSAVSYDELAMGLHSMTVAAV